MICENGFIKFDFINIWNYVMLDDMVQCVQWYMITHFNNLYLNILDPKYKILYIKLFILIEKVYYIKWIIIIKFF